MTYARVQKMYEKDPEITSEQVAKKLKLSSLQAVAWLSRAVTEKNEKERADKTRSPVSPRFQEPKKHPPKLEGSPTASRGRASARER